jgi:beta-galactosidase GanA
MKPQSNGGRHLQPSVALSLTLASFLTPAHAQNAPASPIPHLATRGMATQLMVDGKPYLVLGGELHNSTSSSVDYLDPVLAKFASYNLNTVLGSVNWDMIEPEEGKFDFSMVDDLIRDARSHKLRVVLLWFASWKNGVSTYPPAWVKTNLDRFPRAQNKDGKNLEVLSTFSTVNRDADARAFAALMRHVRQFDTDRTVLMVQVQNEVGILGDPRDHSAAADAAFAQPVPKELIDSLEKYKKTLYPSLVRRWDAAGLRSRRRHR